MDLWPVGADPDPCSLVIVADPSSGLVGHRSDRRVSTLDYRRFNTSKLVVTTDHSNDSGRLVTPSRSAAWFVNALVAPGLCVLIAGGAQVVNPTISKDDPRPPSGRCDVPSVRSDGPGKYGADPLALRATIDPPEYP